MLATATNPSAEGGLASAYASIRETLARFPMPVLELAFRVGIAGVFWNSAMTKTANWDTTVALFRDEYQVPILPPEIAAYLGTTTELLGAIALAFGIAARFGASALLGLTLVIQIFVYPENWLDHTLWAGLLGYVLTRGAGPISVDHFLAKWWLGR
jgi:putative oxidoreductase